MIKKHLFILLFPFLLFSQENQLRIETIDVFKDYVPTVANSIKISDQPIFNDTLNSSVVANKSILNQNLTLKENIFFESPDKFRLNKENKYYTKYLNIDLGTNTFLNTKFHYTNGPSVLHNSGVYFQHNSEAYGLKSPYYKSYDGGLSNSLGAYSNRFFKNRLLESSIEINRNSGLYWGGLDTTAIDKVANYIGNSFGFKVALIEMSNESLLQSINLDFITFSNNYERKEISLNTSLKLQREKALKTYSLLLDYQFTKTIFSNSLVVIPDGFTSSQVINSTINPLVATAYLSNELSDFGLTSKFIISGTKMVDYNIGLNLSYFKTLDIYSDSELDMSQTLIFPTIHLIKDLDKNQRIEFLINKELNYHSFSSLFDDNGYIDPDYRNSISKEMYASFIYSKKLSNEISLFSDVNYSVVKDRLMPILRTNWISFRSTMPLEDDLNPLSLYLSDLKGLKMSSSISVSKGIFDLLLKGTYNLMKSDDHIDKQIIPKFNFNTSIHVQIMDNISLVSNWYYITKREVLNMHSIGTGSIVNYVKLPAYLNTNISINYTLNDMVFSVDFKNIFGQKLNFFDGYFDDDGFKLSAGFFYKF